jgi:hypothetical protein
VEFLTGGMTVLFAMELVKSVKNEGKHNSASTLRIKLTELKLLAY